jgi:site-specific DNA-methyltransferase (adenine-specific)
MEAIYDVDGFRLFQGDALNLMHDLPPESFDMIFADPPYFLSNGGFTVHSGKRASVHKGKWDRSRGATVDMSFHQAWVEEAYRLLKPAGTIWISGTYHSIYQCGFALQSTGFHILNDIAWFKPNASPNLSCRMFTASHETLIWARKDERAKHYFDYKAMKNGDWSSDIMKKPDLQMRSVGL